MAARCASCGEAMTPVVYGYPSGELFDASDRGEVVLGGCVKRDDRPRWRCLRCQPAPTRGTPAPRWRTVAEAYAFGGTLSTGEAPGPRTGG